MARHFRNNRAANSPIDGTELFFKCAGIYHDVYERIQLKGKKATPADAVALGKALNEACFQILREIANAPALDVVPVTRCGSCIYYEARNYLCTHPEGLECAVEPIDFCPFGKAKGGKDNAR
jgi:hypothetical protein